jgi:hypothetical protein
MDKILINVFFIVAFSITLAAQGNTVRIASFKAYGNCSQCKSRIENALKIKEVKRVQWIKSNKMVTVAYSPSAITVDSLQKRVAAVGHDTEKFKALDSVYSELPECCKYRNKTKKH